MKKIVSLLFAVVCLASCNSKENKRPSIYEGEINVGYDESVKAVIDAEMDAYANRYKGAKFNRFVMPESQAIRLFLMDSMDVICTTRLLNEEEQAILKKREITYKPAPMALDAVVLVVNKESDLSEISITDLKAIAEHGNSETRLLFDQGNSSNINVFLNTLELKSFDKSTVGAAGGNEEVIERVQKEKNTIGFVGYNWFSEKHDARAKALRESVKLLKVKLEDESVEPNNETILQQKYPFHRIVYLHTLGTAWGVENGFIRYACTKPGQLIAEKMGLVPYYAIPKEFFLSKESVD